MSEALMPPVPNMPGIEMTAIGASFADSTSLSEWSKFGHDLVRSGHMFNWAIGDWAAFGNRQFGKLKEFAEANNLNYSNLKQLAWVSSSVQKSRRRDQLSWTHHAEVASLRDKEQAKWLEIAQEECLSVAELRRRIRGERGGNDALQPDGPMFRTIGTKFDEVKSFLLSKPVDFWDEDRKRVWKERLRPVVEFYKTL